MHTWEACACLQFLHIYGPRLKVPKIKWDDLERCLADPAGSSDLVVAQAKIMNPLTQLDAVDELAWYKSVAGLLTSGELELDDDLARRINTVSYRDLQPVERLRLLLALCEEFCPDWHPEELRHVGGHADGMVRPPCSPARPV